MRKLPKSLMLAAMATTALSAGAEATWEININSKDFNNGVGVGRGIIADFNNNGHLDIFYSGVASNKMYDKKGLSSWQVSSNMLFNNGNGTFEQDLIGVEPTGIFDDNDLDGDGNPKEYYRYVAPRHGIVPVKGGHYATIDYNNDGLVDLLVSGITGGDDSAGYRFNIPDQCKQIWPNDGDKWAITVLYKNIGDGKFEIVKDCNLPVFVTDDNDGNSLFHSSIAWGDYDRDGYVDVAFSGLIIDPEPGKPDRMTQLWRNIDGTGRFEQVNIAETRGGSWTKAEKVDDIEVIPSQELPGWFLLLSGNVTMADLNNDGWLDIVFDGWCDTMKDQAYEAGSNGRVYLNQQGKKFLDVTDPSGMFYLCRAGNTRLVDMNGDGYLDLLNSGYGDHGLEWKTLQFNNNLGDDPEGDPETMFNYGEPMAQYGLPNHEHAALDVRDFDGDDCLDIMYVGKEDGAIFYGDMSGNYTRSGNFPISSNDARDGYCSFGDLTGNGLADRFLTGYSWIPNREAEMDGINYCELLGLGEWTWSRWIFNNTTDVEIVAPESPANVKTTLDQENKTITVEWDDVDAPNCAYNVVMISPSGKIISNLPVDPVTGFVKVSENKNIAVRPFVNKYTLPANELGDYKLGVQAVSLNNEKASPIAWGEVLSSVGSISADLNNTTVKVTVNGNTIVANADANAEVKVVDMMGRTIATGVTNTPIAVDAKGVLIVTAAGQSVKVVK